MWLIEPPTPAQEAPVYIAAKATAHKPRKKERILGTCEGIEFGGGISIGDGPSIGAANLYMERYEKKPNFFGDGSKTTVTVLQQPAHGELKFLTGFKDIDEGYSPADIPAVSLDSTIQKFNAKGLVIRYIPETDYLGDDSYVVQFDQGGVKVKVKNFFMIDSKLDLQFGGCGEASPWQLKKDGDFWKISLLPSQTTDDLDSWLRATSFQALLSNAVSAVQGFSDLPGLATAQTTGTQITLDSNAAGYGWYFDTTPLDNTDDYLPTADPNIWQARPGSDAEGKMDLLSVLLHEYGHVLGLEHSGDARDFMAATLQPGERRLPCGLDRNRATGTPTHPDCDPTQPRKRL